MPKPPHPTASPTPTDALRVVAPGAVPLSAAARAYNLQLARIDKLKSQLVQMDALASAHRRALTAQVFPLAQRRQALLKDLAVWLDRHLPHDPTLSAGQRQFGGQVLCGLAKDLVAQGHADMAAVHDRHSPRTLAQLARDHAQAMKAQLEALLGEPLLPDQPDADLSDVMHAARARMKQAAAEDEAKAAEREAKRQAKRDAKSKAKQASKPPNEAQLLQASLQGDADTSLRTLYRQLASALHPDRESDPDARLHKTALMSEANAAYARKDYVTLVDIQQRAALADPAAVAKMPDDKLQALTLLVKAQVAELERQRAHTQQQLEHEFDVPTGMGLNANTLKTLLNGQEDGLQEAVDALVSELALVKQDAGLKRWLNQQRKLSQRG
ncbi:MAG: hypothetical protein WBK26_07550 [Burkholderiaceae bacterium]